MKAQFTSICSLCGAEGRSFQPYFYSICRDKQACATRSANKIKKQEETIKKLKKDLEKPVIKSK